MHHEMHEIKNNNANNCRLAVWKQWNVSKLMCVQCLPLLGVERLEILSTRKLEGSLQVTAIVDRANMFIRRACCMHDNYFRFFGAKVIKELLQLGGE